MPWSSYSSAPEEVLYELVSYTGAHLQQPCFKILRNADNESEHNQQKEYVTDDHASCVQRHTTAMQWHQAVPLGAASHRITTMQTVLQTGADCSHCR